ncbi:U-box-domain-containing protein [Patellaria atrata CBS 101060]|uniref:E3 ubiquitin-protein ligase CHIP n=1 Tax=Patellaria atrata CBS 101060 TaxID=1346257 RepID=A0A9P4S4I5_9PEZI|nr:U-box-domain-containing protein [Patellaria atrata CBS 101060]
MAHIADQLKEKGNACFKNGDFESAEAFYSQAIQKYSSNPILWTNRANARVKLERWEGVVDDCLHSIELLRDNMKAYFYLAQAQFAINHPNEAMSSALMAYELCIKSTSQTSSAQTISNLVLKCKKMKWEARERERLRRKSELLGELEDKLQDDMKAELQNIERRKGGDEIGVVTAEEEKANVRETWEKKIGDLRSAFALSDPQNLAVRDVPDYLVDNISFEIMHDPVVTKNGNSYERATLIEHLKRNPYDPLTREPLTIGELRPNIALRQACQEFMETNSGWAYDW